MKYQVNVQKKKFGKVTVNGFYNGEEVGSDEYVFLFEENGVMYTLKQAKKGFVTLCIITKNPSTGVKLEFEKYARIYGDETVEEAQFAITSQSKITDEKLAKRIATAALEFLTK